MPTRLSSGSPEELTSSELQTQVTDDTTTIYTTRYLHTHIDGTYAKLIETMSDVRSHLSQSPTVPFSIPVQGTFFTEASGGQRTQLKVSLVDGSSNPHPVADEVVTLTGTQGQFIKDGPSQPTTYNVFTGSYAKDHRTYLFFFGNTALPQSPGIEGPTRVTQTHTEVVLKKGGHQSRIIVDMEKDLQMTVPSKTQNIDSTVAPDLLMGEGMVDGRIMGGVFIEGSEGFDMEGTQRQGGETSMLTITIGRPVAHTRMVQPASVTHPEEVTVLSMADMLRDTSDTDNEIDVSLLWARKARLTNGEIIADLRTSRPLEVNLPTYTVNQPNVPLEQVVALSKHIERKTEKSVERSVSEKHQESHQREGKSVTDIRARFNLASGGSESNLPTVTYVGFADFTTTIAGTVVVFTPRSGTPNKVVKPATSRTKELHSQITSNPALPQHASEPTALAPRLATEPTILAPSVTEPTIIAPSTTAPTVLAPSIAEPVVLAPSAEEPIVLAPSAAEPTVLAPSVPEPIVLAPSAAEPNVLAPSVTEPATQASSASQPIVLAPSVVEPITLAQPAAESTNLAPHLATELTTLAPRLATSRQTEGNTNSEPPAHTPPIRTSDQKGDVETRMVTQTEGTLVRTPGQDEGFIDAMDNVFSTISTLRFNTDDRYPTGLVSSIGGTIVRNGMTTLLTTYVYGTYIREQYAQIVQSTSSIFYLVSRSATPLIQPTPSVQNIAATLSPEKPGTATEDYNLYDYEYDGYTTENLPKGIKEIVDNALGRSVASSPGQQLIVDTESGKEAKEEIAPVTPVAVTPEPTETELPPDSVTVYTHYTTYFTEGTTTVSTRLETSTLFLPFFIPRASTVNPSPKLAQTEPTKVAASTFLTTYTYYTTLFVDGSTQVSSRTEVLTKTAGSSTSSLIPTPTVSTTTTATTEATTETTTTTTEATTTSTMPSTTTERTTPAPPPTTPAPPPTTPAPPPTTPAPPPTTPSPPTTPAPPPTTPAPPPTTPAPPPTTPHKPDTTTEDTPKADDLTVVEAISVDNYELTTEPVMESFTESMSESMSESSTDSAQDVTEAPRVALDSSLNPEDEVHAVFYPRTYYTTYTYFTTYYRAGTSSIISSLETLTNVVSDPSEQEKHKTLTPVVPTYPVTYYTTYTYWTTFFKENATISTSSEKTLSNIVTPTSKATIPMFHPEELIPVTETVPTEAPTLVTSTPALTTFYTTYTYYTSTYLGDQTIVNSRLETITNVVSSTLTPTVDTVFAEEHTPDTANEPFGFTTTQANPFEVNPFGFTTTELNPSGFADTEANPFGFAETEDHNSFGFNTTVDDSFGFATTEKSPFRFTTNEDKFFESTVKDNNRFGFITKKPSRFTTTEDNIFGFTTTETTPFGLTPSEKNTFGLATDMPKVKDHEHSKMTKSTGLLSTIRGSTVVNGTTTVFSTNIIGTVVDGLYAQIQSTTSIIILPSSEVVPLFLPSPTKETTTSLPFFFLPTTSEEATLSLATLEPVFPFVIDEEEVDVPVTQPTLFATPTLDSSLVDPKADVTPVDTATDALPDYDFTEEPEDDLLLHGKTKTKANFPSTNRNQFPMRIPGSRRRPDILPFLRRTSFRPRPETITRDGVTPTVIATPASTSEEEKLLSTTRPFRFAFADSPTVRASPVTTSARFRFQSPGSVLPPGSSRPGFFGTTSIRHSSPGFRFGSSGIGHFGGSSSPGGFRLSSVRSSVFPGASKVISPSSVLHKVKTTIAPDSDLTPYEDEEFEDFDAPHSNNPQAGFRQFSFRPRQQADTAGTRSSIPFALLNRRPGSTTAAREAPSPSRLSPTIKSPSDTELYEEEEPISQPANPSPGAGFRINRLSLDERRRNRFRQSRPDLSKLFPRRNSLKSDLDNEATRVAPVFVEADGRFLTPEELESILADEVIPEETVVRKKRQAGDFGMRTTARGTARRPLVRGSGRSRDSLPLAPPPKSSDSPRGRQRPSRPSAPTPPQKDRGSQFTLTNANPRVRGRGPTPKQEAKPAEEKVSEPPPKPSAPSRSRSSLPARPRASRTRATVPLGNIRGRGFRRPATDNNVRDSSKFTPTRQSSSPIRRPSSLNSRNGENRNRRPAGNRKPPPSSNPIKEFRNRPSPPVTTEAPAIFPSEDGGFLIQDELTITREKPVKATIPVVEDGKTVQKEVITASLQTEVIQPDQITQTEIDGVIKLLLSTIDGGNEITHYIVDPVETTSVTFTPTFIGGRRTSASVVLPSTAYNVVSVVKTKQGGDIQQLLQLLLAQQQQTQNPLLAALGLGQPMTSEVVHTRSFVTTVTNIVSTAIPIIFRGKTIQTTVVESEVEVVTATEFSTETVVTHGTAGPLTNANPLNQLLPFLLQGQLQQQSPQIRPTREPSIDASKVDPQLLDQLLKQQQNDKAGRQQRAKPEPPPTPAPVETSIVTMYVSGRRPGEFSTILSTVTISGDATRRKRGSLNTKDVQATVLPQYIETDKGLFQLPDTYSEDDIDWFIVSAMNEIDTSDIRKVTPSLESVLGDYAKYIDQTAVYRQNGTHSFNTQPFLWEGPAESAPLKRNVRSAQRGNTGLPEARKIQDDINQQQQQQVVHDNDGKQTSPSQSDVTELQPQNLQAPTTYYTTFTYYTTLVDEVGLEYVQSTEETITQVATHGNVNDFTRIDDGGESLVNSVPVQAKFTLKDAIIPGKPRPVPDPVFIEPPPPFGPVVRYFEPGQAADPEQFVELLAEDNPDKLQESQVIRRKVPPPGSGHLNPQLIIQPRPKDSSIGDADTDSRQKPRVVVLTRKRPLQQTRPDDRVKSIVTQRHPVNQVKSDEPPTTDPTPMPPLSSGAPVEDNIQAENIQDFIDFQKIPTPNEATHEIMETEERDIEGEASGGGQGSRNRVRVTVTSRRRVQVSNTVGEDKTMTQPGGGRRVVVTRRLPQPTVVASPLRPLEATVSTYYTVYSYLYTLYENSTPYSMSTREVTVSNEVPPTVISVLPTFQTGTAVDGFYTLETGTAIATLGERVINSLTTQIFLASATLVDLTPEDIKRNEEANQKLAASESLDAATSSPVKPPATPVTLQSSLVEDDFSSTDTPFLTTSTFRATQVKIESSQQREREDSTPLSADNVATTLPEEPTPSRAGVRDNGRGTIRFADPRKRVRVTVTRRRPVTPVTQDPSDALIADIPEVEIPFEAPELAREHPALDDIPTEPEILETEVTSESPSQHERPSTSPPFRFSLPGPGRHPVTPPSRTSTSQSPEEKKKDAPRLSLEEDNFSPRPSPGQVRFTPRPSDEDRIIPRPSPGEVRFTPRPSPDEGRIIPRPSPGEVRFTPRPSPDEERLASRIPEDEKEPPKDFTFKEVHEEPGTEAPRPTPTPTRPTRPPRTSIRRDDIPIIRRPSFERPLRPFVTQEDLEPTTPSENRLRFTPAPEPEVKLKASEDPPVEVATEPDLTEGDYAYDDYYEDYYYDEGHPESSVADEPVEDKAHALDTAAEDEHSPLHDEAEPHTKASPTVSKLKPKFVRPTHSGVTTSMFDITDALKRERTHTKFVTPSPPRTPATRQHLTPKHKEHRLASNVIYSTFTSTTYLPILGGERSITLTILTSTLITLAEDQLHLITDSPGLFDPSLATPTALPTPSAPLPSLAPSPPVVSDTQTAVSDTLSEETHFTSPAFRKTGSHLARPETTRAFGFASVSPSIFLGSGLGSGRSVVVGRPESVQVEGTQGPSLGEEHHLGARFSIGSPHSLATRVMSNGVEVIVAGDKTASPLPHDHLVTNNFEKFRRPITLPPSTLSDHMLLFTPTETAHPKVTQLAGGDDGACQTTTYFTTYTYYNTFLAGNKPFVVTSKETVENVVTVPIPDASNYIERTEVTFDTHTYFTTQTFTRRVEPDQRVVTSEEVLTQVVITEAPSVQRATFIPDRSSLVIKTYFTTLTYYTTAVTGITTLVSSSTVVSSEVVTETAYMTESPSLDVGDEFDLMSTPTVDPEASFDYEAADEDGLVLYATMTIYTTLTYLTTILQGTRTITTSRTEVSSNIVTESLTSALNSEELISFRNSYLSWQVTPTAVGATQPPTIAYVKLRDNVYKQLRTFFTTYTYYTTLHNGVVNSSLQTETKVFTSTISTTGIPASLLITPTRRFERPSFEATAEVPSLGGGAGVQLDPSYLSSLRSSIMVSKATTAPAGPSEEEGLQATVHVQEGDASGTFVVSDSTTSATLLVRPTEDLSTSVLTGQTIVIFDTSYLSSLKSSYLASVSPVSSSPILPINPAVVSQSPTVNPDSSLADSSSSVEISALEVTDTSLRNVSVFPTRDDLVDESSDVPPTDIPPVEPAVIPIRVDSADAEVSSVGLSMTGSNDNGLNLDLGPMFTAVAGIIRNNLNNHFIKPKSDDDNRRKINPPLLPSNTLIVAQREPLLIPVGGVGASLSSTNDRTEGPEHGFIPLRRPDSPPQARFPADAHTPHKGFAAPSLNPGFIRIASENPVAEKPSFSLPVNIDEMEGFGPTFLPPKTQLGFTAMTVDPLGPTRVSVISGSPTIFFGGVGPNDLPPPGQPAPSPPQGHKVDREPVFILPSHPVLQDETRPVPVPIRVPLPGDRKSILLIVPPKGSSDQVAAGDTQSEVVSSRFPPHHPQPSRVGPQTIVSIEGDNRIVRTQVIPAHTPSLHQPPPIIVAPAHGEFVLHSTVGVGIISGPPEDERPQPPPELESTVVSGSETILMGHGINSGRTTVFRGSSTVMSGATTIFGPLFTRPVANNEPEGDLTSVVMGPGGTITRFVTRVETSARTITATHTEVVFTEGVTSTLTHVIRSTLPLRIIISTIVGTATRVSYITATVGGAEMRDPTTYPPGSPFDPANYPSFPVDPHTDDSELRLPGDAEVVLSESTLGIAEDNEISRVVESKSPDQEINMGGPLRAPVSQCEPQCSAGRHEVCRLVRGAHTCVCRAGYSRKSDYDTCKQSLAYNVQVLLDKMSDIDLVFDPVLDNTSHPITQDLSDITVHGIDQAMRGSGLGPRFHGATVTKFTDVKRLAMPVSVEPMEHGLVVDIKVELSRTEGEEEFNDDMNESVVREALELALKDTNYSLGDSEIVANRKVSVLAADDFDECSHEDHNDCSSYANCFNTPGSYLCACKDGFKDMDDMPGRQCAVQTEQCARCNFQGECVSKPDGSIGCRCLQWFSGDRCQVNLRVLLIVLVTVGSLLVVLLLLCLALCCLRARKNTRNKMGQMPGAPTFLRARSAGMSSTLDRRAMIHETSSESSIDHSRLHATSFMPPMSYEKQERLHRAPRSELSVGRHSQASFAEDRSVGVHTTLPPVLIPRVKGPAPPRPCVVSRGENGEPRVMIGADARSDLASSQQAFVDLLDQPAPAAALDRTSRRESIAAASVHSSARINRSRSHSREHLANAFLHQLHPQPHMDSNRSHSTDRLHHSNHDLSTDRLHHNAHSHSTDRLHHSNHDNSTDRLHHHSNHDLNSEFGVNFSFRGDGERTMSMARSCDETTVRAPIRSLRADSFYSSKALSSQHISDDTDSLSDMSEQHSKVTSSRATSRNYFS
ncbi:mucin-17-like isoform X2 [Cherax quadricarinatus]|uniref:mucin-17-like isoform X2 n=1 Tax=Cherax quadricarinatus TaxID=27406 RepID=UPI00387E46D2